MKHSIPPIAALAAALVLAACAEFRPAGQEIKETGREVGHDVRDAAVEVGRGAKKAAKEAGQATKEAVHEVREKISD
jgi:predicted small secreted protein